MRSRLLPFLFSAAVPLAAGLVAGEAAAQSRLQRTPGTTAGWVGLPAALEVDASVRYRRAGDRLVDLPTIEVVYGLPANVVAGAAFATSSPVAVTRPTELEPYVRWAALSESAERPLQLALRVGFNSAAESLDGEVEGGYRVSRFRLIGAARYLGDAFDDGPRFATMAGLVAFPFGGRAPLSVSGDIGALFGPGRGEDIVWSAGLQAGLPLTSSTLSVHATNTASGTLQGRSFGTAAVRIGLALTVSSPIGTLFGAFVPREVALRSVVPAESPTDVVDVDIREFAFVGERLVVPRGTVVRWTNRDQVVHTATSDDAAWNSGAIEMGTSWSARFDEPGTYSYHCGPHPYMRGTIVVR